VQEAVIPSALVGSVTTVQTELHTQKCDVDGCDEPDETTCPNMKAGEFIEMNLGEEGEGKDGKGCGLEGEEDA
jgi:hypothetical protein